MYINSKTIFHNPTTNLAANIVRISTYNIKILKKRSAFKNPNPCLKQTNYGNGQIVQNDWTAVRVTVGYGGYGYDSEVMIILFYVLRVFLAS